MSSSDAPSTQTGSRFRRIAAIVVFVILGSSLLMRSAPAIRPTVGVGALAVSIGIAIVLLWRRPVTDGSGSDADGAGSADESGEEGDGSSVWNAIPPWQYEGRHVESGGLARGEQTRALQEIQQQADELSEEPSQQK